MTGPGPIPISNPVMQLVEPDGPEHYPTIFHSCDEGFYQIFGRAVWTSENTIGSGSNISWRDRRCSVVHQVSSSLSKLSESLESS